MLTPRRAGPVGPEEIRDGPDDKGASDATSGSVTPGGSYESGDGSKEFLSTGRTGRRNALPNILGRHADTGLSDLPDRFDALSTHSGADLVVVPLRRSPQPPLRGGGSLRFSCASSNLQWACFLRSFTTH